MHRDISGNVQLTGMYSQTVASRYTEACLTPPYPLTHLCPYEAEGGRVSDTTQALEDDAAALQPRAPRSRAKIASLGSVGLNGHPTGSHLSPRPLPSLVSLHPRGPLSQDRIPSLSQLPYLRPDLRSSRLTRAIGARPQSRHSARISQYLPPSEAGSLPGKGVIARAWARVV